MSAFPLTSVTRLRFGTTRGALGLAHCSKCDLKENLWLCLTCGALGCGRKLYGGVGGNGHALSHFEESGHPLCVKLGTITPEGNAGERPRSRVPTLYHRLTTALDIYCYACNDGKIDPELALHLANFGINVQAQKKTEKSMTELVCPCRSKMKAEHERLATSKLSTTSALTFRSRTSRGMRSNLFLGLA